MGVPSLKGLKSHISHDPRTDVRGLPLTSLRDSNSVCNGVHRGAKTVAFSKSRVSSRSDLIDKYPIQALCQAIDV